MQGDGWRGKDDGKFVASGTGEMDEESSIERCASDEVLRTLENLRSTLWQEEESSGLSAAPNRNGEGCGSTSSLPARATTYSEESASSSSDDDSSPFIKPSNPEIANKVRRYREMRRQHRQATPEGSDKQSAQSAQSAQSESSFRSHDSHDSARSQLRRHSVAGCTTSAFGGSKVWSSAGSTNVPHMRTIFGQKVMQSCSSMSQEESVASSDEDFDGYTDPLSRPLERRGTGISSLGSGDSFNGSLGNLSRRSSSKGAHEGSFGSRRRMWRERVRSRDDDDQEDDEFARSIQCLVHEYSDRSKQLEMLSTLGEEADEEVMEQTRQAQQDLEDDLLDSMSR